MCDMVKKKLQPTLWEGFKDAKLRQRRDWLLCLGCVEPRLRRRALEPGCVVRHGARGCVVPRLTWHCSYLTIADANTAVYHQ